MRRSCLLLSSGFLFACGSTQPAPTSVAHVEATSSAATQSSSDRVRQLYTKREVMVPMRDGVKLFTAIYTPKDTSRAFPLLMRRTPYSCKPYGEDAYVDKPGPSDLFTGAGYAFVIQDVRGAYMSEGEFEDMRPHIAEKRSKSDVDESTDTWDTIDWLVKNVAGNNGKVGLWGISYPGFYAAAGMIDAHPALVAVSPQAPIADWWWDDFHHNGALYLPHAFLFLNAFGRPRPEPVNDRSRKFDAGTPDGYEYFSRTSVAELGRQVMGDDVRFWNDLMSHPTYDEFWRARNLLPHLNHVAPAVLTVGGLFDAEDLYGPLAIYREVEQRNPGITNTLVMGPWAHGAWSRTNGDQLGQARFGSKTSVFYREEIEKPFFDHHLLGGGDPKLAEALVFDTGANEWRRFDEWPPKETAPRRLVLGGGGSLRLQDGGGGSGDTIATFVSDPRRPVPYTQAVVLGMSKEHMTEDQRFAARRPDVATFRTEPLDSDVTIVGPLDVVLNVTSDSTDADWIVKLVDVFPEDADDPKDLPLAPGQRNGGYRMLVRGDVMPSRFREGFDKAVPLEAGVPTTVQFTPWDVLHTFKKGHRIEVHVQSTWFPLVAPNPQEFRENPWETEPSKMRAATHSIGSGSSVSVGVLRAN